MTVEDLRIYGADVETGLQRCMNNESFYIRLVNMIPKDTNFVKLYDSIDAGDLDAAFEAAHAIKGSCGNLSLTPLYDPVSRITELLRGRTDTDYSALVSEIKAAYDNLVRICD